MVDAETGAPCAAASASASRIGTGATPPAVRRTNRNAPPLDDDARDDLDQRPFGVGAADRAPVSRAFAGDRRRELDGLDHFAELERMIGGAVRAVAEQLLDAQILALIGRDLRLVSQKRRRHGRGMRGDAWAQVEDDAVKMVALARRAFDPALFQAGDVRIAVVPAARTLGEIAAESGEMADLRRRQTARRGGDAGIGRRKPGVGGDGGDRRRSADPGRPGRVPGDPDHGRSRQRCRRAARATRRCGGAPRGRCPRRGIRALPARGRLAPSSSCGRPPTEKIDQPVGPDRDLAGPDADGVADGVGDRRRRRHGRDLADADAAAMARGRSRPRRR